VKAFFEENEVGANKTAPAQILSLLMKNESALSNRKKCMRFYKITMSSLLVAFCFLVQASDLSERLQSSDHVLLMRHALAPGVGDPVNYSLEECKTQRNLNAEGRDQAIYIGEWLKKQGVTTAAVYSSIWCRCKDTATLLNFNGYQVAPALASFFDTPANSKEGNAKLQKFIAEKIKLKGTQALILVTHHVNILEFMGENIASGDMVLAKVTPKGALISYQWIPRASIPLKNQ
jgi:phosphohistidine phosphatase SixA